ncbi:MAG: MBL fold metallo-hydrolase [Xanthomonadaceae bacterium]|nr:MBL fold metallo-hydrolase [Xanthomonadaceae bacterium]
MRRSRAIAAVAFALVVAAVVAFRAPLLQRVVDARIDANLRRADTGLLDDGQLHVVLCGTAAALPDPDRAGPCTAILADGQFLLIDAGPGSWRVLDRLNLPVARLSALLLTHLHSDHIGEVGEAIEQSWIAGRRQPLPVYGPPGTDDVVAGFAQAYRRDVGYRVAHHGAEAMPGEAAAAIAQVIAPPEGSAAVPVFVTNGLTVEAFRVEHAPVDVAYGYRIRWRGRTVVISGDTRKSRSVIDNARGADLLLHEALASAMTGRAVERATALGITRTAKLAGDVADYHTTPVEAAEVAQAAGVQRLVYTHVFPPLPNALARRLFLAGTAEAYDGPQRLGEDGLRIDFAPRP